MKKRLLSVIAAIITASSLFCVEQEQPGRIARFFEQFKGQLQKRIAEAPEAIKERALASGYHLAQLKELISVANKSEFKIADITDLIKFLQDRQVSLDTIKQIVIDRQSKVRNQLMGAIKKIEPIVDQIAARKFGYKTALMSDRYGQYYSIQLIPEQTFAEMQQIMKDALTIARIISDEEKRAFWTNEVDNISTAITSYTTVLRQLFPKEEAQIRSIKQGGISAQEINSLLIRQLDVETIGHFDQALQIAVMKLKRIAAEV